MLDCQHGSDPWSVGEGELPMIASPGHFALVAKADTRPGRPHSKYGPRLCVFRLLEKG